jgi:tocopherol O-methyltransferase
VTISDEQVRMARKLSGGDEAEQGFISVQGAEEGVHGEVRFVELDAERLGEYFGDGRGQGREAVFDAVWISEALSHFPDKKLFFRNAFKMLRNGTGGKLVIADWFRGEDLSEEEIESDIKPIEGASGSRWSTG